MGNRAKAVAPLGIPLALLVLGFAAYGVTRQLPGIGFGLVAAAGLALTSLVARPRRRATLLFVLALASVSFLAVRASFVWQFFDLGAALALAVLAASYGHVGNPLVGTVRGWTSRGLGLFAVVPEGLLYFAPTRPVAGALGRVLRISRGMALSVALLIIFGIVLTSADAVFAQAVTAPFRWDIDLKTLPQTVIGTMLATAGASTLLAYAARERIFPEIVPLSLRLPIRRSEWIAGLGSVTILFAAFVAVQLPYLFGGADAISVPGVTYAEYARSGFMQMILASVLTLALIGSAWVSRARRENSSGSIAALGCALLGLNMVVLASAFKRLTLYEGAYGWTELRFIAHAIILWLAAFLIMALVALAARSTSWLPMAAAALSLSGLLAINALNPDAFIADRNIERFRASGKVDTPYLASLSADATPTLVEALDELPPADAGYLSFRLTCEADAAQGPWYSWNLGRFLAAAALEGLPPTPTAEGQVCSSPSF